MEFLQAVVGVYPLLMMMDDHAECLVEHGKEPFPYYFLLKRCEFKEIVFTPNLTYPLRWLIIYTLMNTNIINSDRKGFFMRPKLFHIFKTWKLFVWFICTMSTIRMVGNIGYSLFIVCGLSSDGINTIISKSHILEILARPGERHTLILTVLVHTFQILAEKWNK